MRAQFVRQRPDFGQTSLLILFLLIAVAVGAAVPTNQNLAFAILVGALSFFVLLVQPWTIVMMAVFSVLTFKGMSTLGIVPSISSFLDIPLVWSALGAAILRVKLLDRQTMNSDGRSLLVALGALAASALLSSVINQTEILRPILYIALLGQPFALIAALAIASPSPAAYTRLRTVTAGLLLIQIPFTFFQAAAYGFGDEVKGTLVGAGAGHHVVGAICLTGAIWVFANSRSPLTIRTPLALMLIAVPFLSDAKQVILAAPAMLLVSGWRKRLSTGVTKAALISMLLLIMLVALPAGEAALQFLRQGAEGRGGKSAALRFIANEINSNPMQLVVGLGPGTTVSRTAFMTTDLLLLEDSPLRSLNLKPAEIAIRAEAEAERLSGGRTSFNSAQSSAIGLFGDLGILGSVSFSLLLFRTFRYLRKGSHPELAVAAASGWAIYTALGFVFDWWEQPPFTVFIATLAALSAHPTQAPGTDTLEQRIH